MTGAFWPCKAPLLGRPCRCAALKAKLMDYKCSRQVAEKA
jgi:hypothetical protein